MGRRRGARDPVNILFGWVRRQSVRVQVFLGAVAALVALVGLKIFVRDYEHFYIASEAVHAAGILLLIYKLTRHKTCSGLSLKSQELTAIFLAVRLYCSFIFEKDIHTILDFATLAPTLWVIYMIRYKLNSSYDKELDNMPRYYLVLSSVVIAVFVHPISSRLGFNSILWAFCMYLESISVLPQLRVMQNAKMVEPFTAHYVFALGVARFLGCAHWILRLIESRGAFLYHVGTGFYWTIANLTAEGVQTFILADFCYYYIKSAMYDQLLRSLSSPV
ncbi:ER lumen protein-retaining receptor [Dioscorea cayenensis subsp. rotundata]|uniref:ER lumen protein-retaining receptor n=1 Tax=Dioscorea cayennensis subsp. rotundata TaxID=55577 RepID=A0AB40BA95_DIOCR|nr:ER lumen protein-retaining receptor [Dioscorea cayenensis subsp. rotundata]